MDEIDKLLAGEHVALYGPEFYYKDVLGHVVSTYAIYKEAQSGPHDDWQVVLISPRLRRSEDMLNYICHNYSLPVGKRLRLLYSTRKGRIWVAPMEAERVMGNVGWNILYLLLDCQSINLWDVVGNSVVAGTVILALNPIPEFKFLFEPSPEVQSG